MSYTVGRGPYGIVAGDFNGDGKPDIAVVNGLDNTISVLLNNKSGGFPSSPNYTYAVGSQPFGLSMADLNKDGFQDLVVANLASGNFGVLLGKGDGSFKPQVTYATGSDPLGTAIADLNGDGYPDLAVANLGNGTVGLLLGKGDGTFLPQTAYLAEDQPYSLPSADFNGDGKADLAVTSFYDNTIGVMLQTAPATTSGRVKGTPQITQKPVTMP